MAFTQLNAGSLPMLHGKKSRSSLALREVNNVLSNASQSSTLKCSFPNQAAKEP